MRRGFGPREGVGELARRLVGTVFMSMSVLWLLTLVCTRLHLFHNAYIHHIQTIEDEKWLLYQCQDPAFFANLKQHVSLCQKVEENARKTPVLVALNETMSVSSMCGTVNCWDLIYYVQNGGVSLVTLMSIAAIALVTIVLPAANVVSRWISESSAGSDYSTMERGYDIAIPAVREHDAWVVGNTISNMMHGRRRDFHKKVV